MGVSSPLSMNVPTLKTVHQDDDLDTTNPLQSTGNYRPHSYLDDCWQPSAESCGFTYRNLGGCCLAVARARDFKAQDCNVVFLALTVLVVSNSLLTSSPPFPSYLVS